MATDKEYIKPLSATGDAIRVRFSTERGQVIRYTVQYEMMLGGSIRPVIRYDNAHGQAHNDLLNWQGETILKEWLSEGSGGDALTRAIGEIEARWEQLREDFLRRKP